MELVRALKHRITKPSQPDSKQIRLLRPVKNEFVQTDISADGSATLSAPLETQLTGIFLAASRKMKNLPTSKTFSLDPVGTFVWNHCDGVDTVEKIAQKLQQRYKMSRLEAETALSAYLQTLSGKKLITLQGGAGSKLI